MMVLHVLMIAVMMVVATGATVQAQQSKPSARKSTSGQPKPAQQLFYDGFEAYQANRFKEAITLFEQGLRQDSTNAVAAFYLGEAYEKTGNQAKAQQWYATSLAADPQSTVAGAAYQARERFAAGQRGVAPPQQAEPPRLGKEQQNSIGMEFVLLQAGTFQMGSNDGDDAEKPVHTVHFSRSFYLGKYEVTQAQWKAVMGNNPSFFTGDPSRPVERVSWDDVQDFIRRLNAKESGARYRLPTEAEWEYAARAGSTTAYSSGNGVSLLGQYAWYKDNAGETTHPVGRLQPNAWGLYDMHGNVWEWVEDWYGVYPIGSIAAPAGPLSGSHRVLRGGGWGGEARFCRSADRNGGVPASRGGNLGFRLLREVP